MTFDVDGCIMQTTSAGIANLLRSARSECGGLLAFVAVDDGDEPGIVTFPAGGGSEQLPADALRELVHQSWLDPEFRNGRPFVRSVGSDVPLALAVAPLGDGAGRGMVGVVAPAGQVFEPMQLASLDGVAQRMGRHLRARRELLRRLPGPGTGRDGADGSGAGEVTSEEEVGSTAAPLSAEVPEVPLGAGMARPQPAPERPGTVAAGARAEPEWGAAVGPAPDWAGSTAEQPPARSWAQPDELAGLAGLGQFFSRAGRLFGCGTEANAIAVVVVEVGPPGPPAIRAAARALSGQLRFSDPLARIGKGTFASVVALFPGSTRGDVVEARLAESVRAALGDGFTVRSAHVVAKPGDRRELDELLDHALVALRAG
jgi:hypothetical protein